MTDIIEMPHAGLRTTPGMVERETPLIALDGFDEAQEYWGVELDEAARLRTRQYFTRIVTIAAVRTIAESMAKGLPQNGRLSKGKRGRPRGTHSRQKRLVSLLLGHLWWACKDAGGRPSVYFTSEGNCTTPFVRGAHALLKGLPDYVRVYSSEEGLAEYTRKYARMLLWFEDRKPRV